MTITVIGDKAESRCSSGLHGPPQRTRGSSGTGIFIFFFGFMYRGVTLKRLGLAAYSEMTDLVEGYKDKRIRKGYRYMGLGSGSLPYL